MNSPSKSLRNAAIVLKNLPPEQVQKVVSRLNEGDVRNVFQEIEKLDVVTSRQIFDALDQLARDAQKQLGESKGPKPTVPRVGAALPPTDDPLHTEEIRNSPFYYLARTEPALVTLLIQDEHPADIALILAQLPSNVAAVQLKSLDPVLRVSVLKRVCQLETINGPRSNELAYELKIRMQKILSKGGLQQTGVQAASKMLNFVDTHARQELLAQLNDSDPDTAREISNRIFKFDQLAQIPDEAIKVLLQHVDTSCWGPALKRTSLDVCRKILGNMASKPAKLLTREMQMLGHVDKHIAAHAQQQILAVYLRLHDQGKLPQVGGPAG